MTGVVPPDGFSRLTQVENKAPDPLKPLREILPIVPMSVAQAIDRAMSLDVEQRFASVEQFWEVLQEEMDTPPTSHPIPILSNRSFPPTPLPVSLANAHTASPATITAFQTRPPVARSRFSIAGKPIVLLAILAVLIALGAGGGFAFHIYSYTTSTSEIVSTGQRQEQMRGHFPTITSTGYPGLAETYNGTIFDLAMNMKTSLSLTNIRQNQANFSGFLIISLKLKGSGSFSGTFITKKHFQFTVTDANGNALFFFEGSVQSATSLSGDYYRCTPSPGNPCPHGPDAYGIWNVVSA